MKWKKGTNKTPTLIKEWNLSKRRNLETWNLLIANYLKINFTLTTNNKD